ncbi:MAG: glutamine-hydrolyzing carbamoyl-phosphate synthase small subunit [Cryomorphaceae bacterium]|nr:glutamine-hydrolyzing carbamoyl-phosphate synthase small subunit [Cryomorphaceae bacterium]
MNKNETNQPKKAVVLLEDGAVFYGISTGADGSAVGEICFNTGMTGYQEIFTDPSYFGQIMVTTNAHIGNYGVLEDEAESNSLKIAGLVCRNFTQKGSRVGKSADLIDDFRAQGKVSITGVDTRALVRYIRKQGAMNAVISTETQDMDALRELLKNAPSMEGLSLAGEVSTEAPYFFGSPEAKFTIAAMDFGIKQNILRCLAERDCYIKVFPADTALDVFLEFECDGYFLSNGPGDPAAMEKEHAFVAALIEKNKPVFGICLGHQLIALSQGLTTYKMHHGHRGINHPILNKETGLGEISSQNHGFAVSADAIENNPNVELTHIHLNDQTVAGIRLKNRPVFSVQYHPESAPGPHDSRYLFDNFISLLHHYSN